MIIRSEGPEGDLARDWAQRIDDRGGNPLHLPEVHRADQPPETARYLAFGKGDPEALALAFTVRGGRRLLRARESNLVLPSAPAMNDRGRRAEIYTALLDHARTTGFDRLTIGHSWGDTFEDLPFLAGHITDQVTDFVIDLRPSLEDLVGSMHKVHRKNIRRAERAGLTVTVDHGLEALLELRRFQHVSAERARTRGDGFAVRDEGYFRSIQEAVYGPGLGAVHLAHLEGTCIGAMAYLASGSRGVTVRSGCDAKGYETYAMYLLQLSVIEHARNRGVVELNIGGVPREAEEEGHPQNGLHAFKKGFGGTAHLRQAVSRATAEALQP